VLVATKRTARESLTDAVRAIPPSTPVVLLQNGVHAARELAEVRSHRTRHLCTRLSGNPETSHRGADGRKPTSRANQLAKS